VLPFPRPCSPRPASSRRECGKSSRVLRPVSGRRITSPPRPPSPPIGPTVRLVLLTQEAMQHAPRGPQTTETVT
jgi:hypothetical protein